MTTKFAILAMTGLALVGCNRGTANNSAGAANNSATVNAAAPAAPAPGAAPMAGAGAPVDQAFLVGHWGPAGICTQTVSFEADGTAQATGQTDARWQLEGGNLIIQEEGKPPQPTPVSRSGDNLVLTGPQGQQAVMSRCPAAGTGGPAAGKAGEAAEEKTQ